MPLRKPSRHNGECCSLPRPHSVVRFGILILFYDFWGVVFGFHLFCWLILPFTFGPVTLKLITKRSMGDIRIAIWCVCVCVSVCFKQFVQNLCQF